MSSTPTSRACTSKGETFEAFCRNVASAVGDLLEGEGGEAHIEIIAHASIRARVAACA